MMHRYILVPADDMFRYYVDEVFPLTITSFNLRQHSNFCSLTVADEIIEFQHCT